MIPGLSKMFWNIMFIFGETSLNPFNFTRFEIIYSKFKNSQFRELNFQFFAMSLLLYDF
jgi:hypothetical protein